jgi:SPP1 gp7 family putative phage head morphogenesis protein
MNLNLSAPSDRIEVIEGQQIAQEVLRTGRRKPTLKPIHPPKAVQNEYMMQLKRLVDKMNRDVQTVLMPVLKSSEPKYRGYTADSWLDSIVMTMKNMKTQYNSSVIESFAEMIASKFVKQVDNYNKRKALPSFGINALGKDSTQDYLKFAIHNNVSLIKSIPTQFFGDIESAVLSGINDGASYKDLQDIIERRYNVTESRARLIARDQTAKVNGQLTATRQVDAGIDKFEWLTSDDERVRDSHKELEEDETEHGRGVYLWSDPPRGLKNKRIIPGFEFQCRCVAIPVVD